MSTFKSHSHYAGLIAAASFLLMSPLVSQAEMIGEIEPPTITIAADGYEPEWSFTPDLENFEMVPGRPSAHRIPDETRVEGILGQRANVVIEELEFDPDPFVLNNILITNATAITQTYTIGVTLPTSFGAPNLISGNVRTDVIDGGGAAGATVSSVAGFPIYSAQIDFAEVATLQDAPFTVTAPAAGSNSMAASFGPTVNLVPVGSDMGIELRFSLTAGDTASILSRFDVVAVPEPTSLGLCALSLLAMVAIGRRK